MRKLNGKNKFYIAIFSMIILLIVGILIVSLILSRKNLKTVYNVSSNSVVFDSETNLIDTSSGGEVAKKWNDEFYYISRLIIAVCSIDLAVLQEVLFCIISSVDYADLLRF